MTTLLQLQKKRDDALAALASASNDKAKSAALAQVEKASMDLATFKSQISSKSKTFVKKEEKYTEDDSESESASASAEEGASASASAEEGASASASAEEGASASASAEEADDSSASSASSSSAGSSMSEEAEEDAKKAKSLLASKAGLYSYDRLFALTQQVTGKKGVREVFGALDAIGARLKAAEELEGRVAKIETKQRKEKVDALLKAARSDGKITKDAIPSLRAKGLTDTRWLKAHLEALPKRVRTLDEGVLAGQAFDGGKDGDERRSSHLDAQNLSADQRKVIETMAQGSGKSFDEFVADMNKRLSGAERRSK